jgi:hypothetical protein
MTEGSTTVLPLANTNRPHVETGVEHMSLVEEAQRAAKEAEKQSTKKVK